MKLVELKKIEDFSYKENLIAFVENSQGPIGNGGAPTGLSPADIRKSIRILDVLEQFQDGEVAELEDEDHSHLVSLLENARFVKVHRPTIQMIDDVKAAKSKSKERIKKE